MKKTSEIIGLPVVSILGGLEVGRVLGFIVDADERQISYFVVDYGRELIGAKLIAAENVIGIGEFALTIENENAIILLTKSPDALDALEKGITIINTKAITNRGRNVGDIAEIFVDENQKCRIVGTEFILITDEGGFSVGAAKLLPDRCVITYGKLLTVIEDSYVSELVDISDASVSPVNMSVRDVSGLPRVPATPGIGFAATQDQIQVSSVTLESVDPIRQSAPIASTVHEVIAASEVPAEAIDVLKPAEPAGSVAPTAEQPATEAAEAPETQGVSETSQVTEIQGVSETSQVSETSEASETLETTEVSKALEAREATEASEVSEAEAEEGIFEDRQRKYLLDRKVSKKIVGNGGTVIATEGTVITDEIITKAKEHGKMVQLVMNNRA